MKRSISTVYLSRHWKCKSLTSTRRGMFQEVNTSCTRRRVGSVLYRLLPGVMFVPNPLYPNSCCTSSSKRGISSSGTSSKPRYKRRKWVLVSDAYLMSKVYKGSSLDTYRTVQVSIEFEHWQNYLVPNLSTLILKCVDVTHIPFMRLEHTVVSIGKKQLAYMIWLQDGLKWSCVTHGVQD